MRLGTNPQREQPELPGFGTHRVIIPVHIPNFDGYYAGSLEVLKICLESLHLTAKGMAVITVVSNGCTTAVVDALRLAFERGWIEHLILSRHNLGKVDAVVGAARGTFEPCLTIADCDIFFRPGWIEETRALLHVFPEAGFVSPFCAPHLTWYHSTATLLAGWIRGELNWEKAVKDETLEELGRSLGWPGLAAVHRRRQLVIKRGSKAALVGGGHCVFTTTRDVLEAMPRKPALTGISPASDEKWFDLTPDRMGLWRLSTVENFAYHMGNTAEGWFYDALKGLRLHSHPPNLLDVSAPPRRKRSLKWLPYAARALAARILKRAICRNVFVRTASGGTSP
jgi:hypothetical protein